MPNMTDTTRRIRIATALKASGICAIIGIGLLLDQKAAVWGQYATDVAVWAIFFAILARVDRAQQARLVACVIYATLGEMFL